VDVDNMMMQKDRFLLGSSQQIICNSTEAVIPGPHHQHHLFKRVLLLITLNSKCSIGKQALSLYDASIQ
jgi:hypothetical protein